MIFSTLEYLNLPQNLFKSSDLAYSDKVLVTSVLIVDGLSTMMLPGGLVKILAWYDNEYGYVHRMAELTAKVARNL